MPVFEIFYKPRSTVGEIISIKEIEKIPSGVVVSGSYGIYASYSADASRGAIFYLIYDPVSDTIYLPVSPPTHIISRAFLNRFLDSWAYKSFEFARNPISKAVDVSDLQSKIINALKPWVLIALGLGLAFLVVRFGPAIMIRLFLPFAVLGAIGRIGRSNKDE